VVSLTVVEAIYEGGVFKPVRPVKLSIPEGTRVRLIIRPSVKEFLRLFEGIEAREDIDKVFTELRNAL